MGVTSGTLVRSEWDRGRGEEKEDEEDGGAGGRRGLSAGRRLLQDWCKAEGGGPKE